MTKTKAARAPKGTPTGLNISVLAELAFGRREFPNRIESVSVPHIRRCLKAGYVEIASPTTLRVTDVGVAAIHAQMDEYPTLAFKCERVNGETIRNPLPRFAS